MSGSSSKQQSTLNILGVLVLVLGLAAASIVLVRGQAGNQITSNPDWQDDTLAVQDSKSSSYDVERYDGKMGLLAVKLLDAFHQPQSLALIIAAGSTLFALGCFYISRRFSK